MDVADTNSNSRIHQAVHPLFFMTPSQLEFIESRHRDILSSSQTLKAFETPGIDDGGLETVQRLTLRLTGSASAQPFFSSAEILRLRDEYELLETIDLGSVDDMLEFQLGLLVWRLCSDYVDGNEFYAEHSQGFRRLLSRILVRNEVTGDISWMGARDATRVILENNFAARYDAAGYEFGSFYRVSRLANEALCIARRTILEGLGISQADTSGQVGRDFEKVCGNELTRLGFQVQFTKVSGDFGCDILATKDGLQYALQCKSLAVPVGIGAVQEAASSRSYYQTDYAGVISRSGFTRAAKDLATSTNVVLVADSCLADIMALARSTDSSC